MLSDVIEGALYLSYDELPHHLKQCFLYCGLFTEDSTIHRDTVTKLWIAEGFVEQQQGQLLEDIAEEYYYKLIHRNLLQPDNRYFDQLICRMHGLLRHLALHISQEECFMGDVETLRAEDMSKLRRVTAVSQKDKLVLPRMDKVDVKVRTFLTFHGRRNIEDTLFKRFLLLRVLVLNYSLVQSIPDHIGKLIHLRLLNLDCIGISCLPESIGSLKNLQVLSLRECNDMHSLPLAMTLLCSLRSLDLLGTEINQVPKGIGKLKFLTELRDCPVGDGSDNAIVQDGWKLEEFSSLPQMRHLLLLKLERAAYCSTDTVLTDKKHLKVLKLSWSELGEVSYLEEDVCNSEKVFEQLVPPCHLEKLFIVGFFGRRFPTWFGTCLSSVMLLFLKKLRSCVDLPSMGQLPNLAYLRIDGAHAVTKVGLEILGCGKGDSRCNEFVAFPKLEWLVMKDMPNWEEWSFSDGDDKSARLQLLPRLVKLKLEGCPMLRALPRQLGEDIASLKKLELIGTNNLKAVEDFPHLTELLRIEYCGGLERISNLPQLMELRVYGCPNLKRVEGLSSLQQLGLGEDMQEISSCWVPGLQEQHQQLHGEDLDVYTLSTS